jgi:replicative DNA helicase
MMHAPRNDTAIESEQNIVGGLFVRPSAISEIAAIAKPAAFTHPGCRAVYSAMLELHRNAEPIDVLSVWNHLKDAGEPLTHFGGMDFLTNVYAGVVTVSNLDYHAKQVADKALRRSAFRQLREASEHVYDDADLDDAFARARRSLDDLKAPAAPTWIAPSDRALAIGGAQQLIPTDFATLDKATRGGLRAGKVIVFGGAPGAGKTTWAIQLAWKLAKLGICVAVLAADEDANGLLVRIGQLEGLQREDLEDGLPYARLRLSEILKAHENFILVDADESEATVEQVSAELKRVSQGKPSLLVADSIQTIKAQGCEEAEGPRARIDAVIAALKKCAKVDGHLVIATCELARGAYRSQNAADRIDDLAAFKESGGIEYGVTTALVLRSVATENGEEGLVDVTIPKNRLGTKPPFRLRLDSKRASFEEVELPQGVQKSDTALEQIKCRVLETVAKALDPIASKNELARRTRKSKKPTLIAIDELLDEGRLTQLKGVFSLPNGHGASMGDFGGSRTGSRTASPVNGSSGSISQRDWNREPEPVPGTRKPRSVPEPLSHLSASVREPGEDDG